MDDEANTQSAGSAQDLVATPVRDVMSVALVTVADDESVLMAWEIMQRTGFHHLPVMNSEGRCLGILERAELAVACAAPATAVSEARVLDLISEQHPVIHDHAPVSRAAVLMTQVGADALPVLDASGALAGMLTARDIVALVAGQPKRRPGPAGAGPVHFSLEPVLPYPFDD
ncbi:CBS domain-containing protein [Yinghuangia soli]|uniref:CBS domain-containing protein n=1 Tax=Yinghuangia soli TaxID=2908204 RepID=A0AA41Q0E4_9ACTN|nr:CBS domain-containing protein [Yinghuangia soli]MCF2528922.1 CBS domain-containing protein [Yinghuangia soli]